MSLSYDIHHLFAEIESRPVLWDPSDEQFNNRERSKEAWIDVGKIVISSYETLKYSKQCEYLDQIKRKYYNVRAAYRNALKRREPFYLEPQMSFLNRVWNFPTSKENSTEVSENVETQKYLKEASPIENDHNSLMNSLKPVLSIKKIDSVREKQAAPKRGRVGRPPKHLESPKVTKPIVSQEQPIIDSDDEPKEKKCRYQCDVQLASTQESTPPRRTSTYASLTIEDDRQSTDRRIVPSYNLDTYNERSSRNDSYNDRPHNYDIHIDRPVRERPYSPPPSSSSSMRRQESYFDPSPSTTRRQESYFDPHRYPMFPTVPLDYHDDDMAFFRSLLTWTKRFSEDEKLEFRSEVMRLVSRIRSYESAGNYYVLSQTPLS